MALVYKITNTINGKMYFGFTERPIKERWAEHKAPCRLERETVLYKAIKKYGIENFTIEEVFNSINSLEALRKEREFIEQYNTYGQGGYNSTLGGDKQVFTPEIKAKISASKMGHFVSEETRHKVSNGLKSHFSKYNKEERRKMLGHNQSSWIIYHKGELQEVNNLKDYCKMHNLKYESLVANKGSKAQNIGLTKLLKMEA